MWTRSNDAWTLFVAGLGCQQAIRGVQTPYEKLLADPEVCSSVTGD